MRLLQKLHRVAGMFTVMLTGVLISACGVSASGSVPTLPSVTWTPYVLQITATPELTVTEPSSVPTLGGPTWTPYVVEISATPEPSPTPTATITLTPAGTPTPRLGENLLANPGFEGTGHKEKADNIIVADEWKAFYCAKPFRDSSCSASAYAGILSGNPNGLAMDRPVYFPNTTRGRRHGSASAQMWACPYHVCRGGVYQTFHTTPGQVCEASVWVQSYSAAVDSGIKPPALPISALKTADDKRASTWYLRVDPTGGHDPWGGVVEVSRPFGYDDGIYDRFARITMTFTATSDHATLFVENMRLWPLLFNESYIDDAVVACRNAAPDEVVQDAAARFSIGSFTTIARHLPWPGSMLGHFLQVGNEWWTYYGAEGGIRRAFSSDGMQWVEDTSPVLGPGAPSSWDAAEVLHPSVIYDSTSGQFQMWYLGTRKSGDLNVIGVGYATSSDGLHFEHSSPNPVITSGAPGSWSDERIDGPTVIKVGDQYRLYLAGSQLQPDLIRQVGCFTSPDGLDWTPCLGNPILRPRPDLAPFEGKEVEKVSFVIHDGVYLMAYTGYLGPQGSTWEIGLAASLDGLHWQRLSSNPIISLGDEFQATFDPVLIYDEPQGLLLLYFEEGQGEFSVMAAPIEWK